MTFEELKRWSPKVAYLPPDSATDFWEELFQLFKKRMLEETTNSEGE